MRVVEFKKQEKFVEESVEYIAGIISEKKEGIAYVGIGGGNTPRPVYLALGMRDDINFSVVEFFVVDERYVPYDHVDSNFAMIQETLGKRVHDFDTSLSIEEALSVYEKEVQEVGIFDLIILGMGIDGHVASVFSSGMIEGVVVAHTTTETLNVHDRLTMTLPSILKAKNILLLLGREKADTWRKIVADDSSTESFPVRHLLSHPSIKVHLML
jgi:6-phosphogluconolactonase